MDEAGWHNELYAGSHEYSYQPPVGSQKEQSPFPGTEMFCWKSTGAHGRVSAKVSRSQVIFIGLERLDQLDTNVKIPATDGDLKFTGNGYRRNSSILLAIRSFSC